MGLDIGSSLSGDMHLAQPMTPRTGTLTPMDVSNLHRMHSRILLV
jgi:hypothetical protein